MERNIRIEQLLPYSCDQVWHMVADSATLTSWFMPTNDFAPELHHAFTFRMKPQRGWDGVTYCEVIKLDRLRQIAFSYRGRASGEKTLACAGIHSQQADAALKGVFTELDTVLRFTLVPDYTCSGEEHTRFVLEHTGFKGVKQMVVSVVMGMGWRKVLRRMVAVLESQERVASGEASTVTA